MHALIEQFADDQGVQGWQTYQHLVQVFQEQCEVVGSRIEVKAHPGNDVMQNPSDPDATRDGHKGPGYQAQIVETCSEANEVQLITSVLPQTAAEDDRDAMPDVLDDLDAKGLLPEVMYADTHYGSDESVQTAADKGVDVQAPVSGACPEDVYALNIDDFVVDHATETVERCPAGHTPVESTHDPDTDRTRTVMPPDACGRCEFFDECPVRCVRGRYVLDHTGKERRLAARRREEATDAFHTNYRRRAGIESTNGGLKRREGLGRVRARGQPRVSYKIVMKTCGWNVLRAAATKKLRARVAKMMAVGGHARHFGVIARPFRPAQAPVWPVGPLFQHTSSRVVQRKLALAA
jgi:hypothetical protein